LNGELEFERQYDSINAVHNFLKEDHNEALIEVSNAKMHLEKSEMNYSFFSPIWSSGKNI